MPFVHHRLQAMFVLPCVYSSCFQLWLCVQDLYPQIHKFCSPIHSTLINSWLTMLLVERFSVTRVSRDLTEFDWLERSVSIIIVSVYVTSNSCGLADISVAARQRRKSGDDVLNAAVREKEKKKEPSPGFFEYLGGGRRPRSKSDASRVGKKPNILTSVKNAVQVRRQSG